MGRQHFFVTGAMGCIGAWVVRNLLMEGEQVTIFDLSRDTHRLELVVPRSLQGGWSHVAGDVTDLDGVTSALVESGASHVIHLAALQVPFCRANPSLGAAVNVVGTVNLFEASKQAGLGQLTYASSVAVYGRRESYPVRLLDHHARLDPLNLYGVYKQANEGTARIYWQDDGISSVGLRPYTVYGPGRDQGLTSTPTKAMLAAARGEGYQISYGGTNGFQYADDVAKLFVMAARRPHQGAEVFNLQGSVAHMSELVQAIEKAAPTVKGQITYQETPLPFPEGQEDSALTAWLGERPPSTPLSLGVKQSIAHFEEAIAAGLL
jgi:nucleoside-diphosphate-sugar epimerase